jgi:predicted RNase H-like HicB family nuclease
VISGEPAAWVWNNELRAMHEITLQVQRDEESGWLVASWDDPDGTGGITTQGRDLRDLQEQITEAVAVHFDAGSVPCRIRIHFVSDPILIQA